ncbi:MAG: xanthine dehydrogenase family protein molybdopterin-binding subunit [Chloroflexi bacterium]|nr:xanthine dehydrogenase family protein molybdopterin-binding subunit [Chloroflexota bacterium]
MTTIELEQSVVADTPQTGKQYDVIGTRPIRHDGYDKVTGRALYGADIRLNDMLYGKVLRSPHAHARILSIDTSRALALPGVKAIVTTTDLPSLESVVSRVGEGAVNWRYLSNNILANDKVLYHGHAVAAVAATSMSIAEEAISLIQVEYELLPVVTTVQQAVQPDAPILLEELRTSELGAKGEAMTNIASHDQFLRGDLERGFAEATAIVEREFITSTVHQGYIEPHSATAIWGTDGLITIWTSTQGAHDARRQAAEVLQLPVSRIKVVPMEIGGGFGGKTVIYLEPVAALLSQKSGNRPVQLTMTRWDVLAGTGPTSGSVIKVKMGADKKGRITAAQASLTYAAGAYPGSPVGAAMAVIFNPYNLENVQVDGYDVVTNTPRAAAYRAPGGTNAAFASESVIDELASRLGIDPLQIRHINGAKEGDRRVDGPLVRRIGYLETVEKAQASAHYQSPLPAPSSPGRKVGRGVASGWWGNWPGGTSSVSVVVNNDGAVTLIEGSTDIGGSRVAMAMQLAETLGLQASDIKPLVVDTDSVGYNDVTAGSRTTYATGIAVYKAGLRIIDLMRERAAEFWDVDISTVQFDNGVISARDRRLSFKELARSLGDGNGNIVASVSISPNGDGVALATHIVDVEVDTGTGKVQILRYTAIQDVGTAIHPAYVEGQMQGGAAQGIGWALNEEYVYDQQGHLLNGSMLDYRIPTALDLPMIDAIMVETPNPTHPFGVRGVGEVPIVPPAGAIANAIHNAIGVRMEVLPMSPRRVLEAMWAQK